MSKYHDELERRLKGTEPISDIAMWFMRCVATAEPKIQWEDFTPLEYRIFCILMQGCKRRKTAKPPTMH